MNCPNCNKEMKDDSYWDYGIGSWDMDYPDVFHEKYKCKDCRIEYINGEWIVPKKFERATYKQVKCANFICNELGMKFEPVLKMQTWKFINTYLDKAKHDNKQRRDANFRDWCEDNMDWLPEYY